jgi:CheY-like chemotaxis protein
VIRNAVKFTPKGGSIVIRSGNGNQRDLWLEVSDTGVGFAADAASRLFTAFQQEDESVARQFGGLGLGLTITRSVLDAHGGSISGSSQGRDKGATFIIRLPLSDSVQPGRELTQRSPRSSAVGKSAGLRLLLVEDHEETSLTMQRLLKRMGHEVTATNSAQTALAWAAENPFDLVISDLGLPDMSGMEMMQQMRDRHGLRGIAVSGFGTEEDIAESHASGFVHHLTKPISIEKLNAMLSDLV